MTVADANRERDQLRIFSHRKPRSKTRIVGGFGPSIDISGLPLHHAPVDYDSYFI
jgi:hypothetical protein